MANQSISQLPVATTLTGDELTVVVQNGVTKQTQLLDITNIVVPGRLIDYLYFDGNSDLIVVYTDSTTQNLGPIPGYIAAEIAPNGHLILTNSDGGTTDAGSVFASLAQTFLTVGNETSSLANSSRLVAGSNITLTQGANTLTISTSGASGSLNGAGTGIIVKDSSTSVVARTLTSTAGISITNPDGIAGNPVISPELKLADIQNLATTGLLAVVGGTTVVDRNIVGTASQITVVDGDGSGNPTIEIADNPVLPGTGSVTVPTGDTAQRPGNLPGQIRFNSQLDVFEGQDNAGVWKTLALGGGVTSVSLGTGLTGSPNPITSTGTISITNTGVTAASYGDATNVAQIVVNAQGQITSAANVAITASGIGAITAVNGTANEISSSQVGTAVTLSLPSALTFTGKTVTNGTFNMAAATVGSDTVTTNTASQTLTNKTISGASNTLTNIGNSSLTNSTIVLGTSTIALGGTELAPVGLTSVTVTQDPTTNFQLATKQYVDTIATTGIDYHLPVYVESPDTAGNLNATYNQPGGAGVGVGATLTNAGTQAALTIDGVLTTVGMRVLIYNQTNAVQNGVYTVTVVGSGSTNWVLTRATDADTYGINDPNKLDQGSTFFVQAGTTGAGETYTCNTSGVITFGTTPITFVQISSTQVYSAGTGLGLSGTQFYIANTAVSAGAYGSASSVGTFTVNAQGQLTLAGSTTIAISNTQVSGLGTMSTQNANNVAITGGAIDGTPIGATTASTVKATTVTLTGAGSSADGGGQVYLNGTTSNRIDWNTNGTGAPAYTTRSAGAKLVLYPNLSGSAADYAFGIDSGTLWSGIPANDAGQFFKWYGGTTLVASLSGTGAFNANSASFTNALPTASGGTGLATVGTNGQVLTSNGTSLTWSTPTTGTVTSVSGTGTVSGLTLSGTVTTSGSLTLGGTLDLSSPPAIGGTTPNAITGTTITATKYVGISGGTF